MKVLVIGSGAREHALAWRLSRSGRVDTVVTAPGNGGTAALGPTWELDPVRDAGLLEDRIRREGIDRVVIGPEAPLVAGTADRLRAAGIRTFGPGAAAARLEGSKSFAKEFLSRHGIPTAPFRIVSSPAELAAALERFPSGVVVKADGLAAGKGVVIAEDRDEAERAALPMLSGESFADAGRVVVLEERLRGVEVSMLALVAGSSFRWLEPARDYKALLDGDRGPNTGGMGAYSPAGTVDAALAARIDREILHPTLAGLAEEAIPYRGVLYIGLMLTPEGPQVLEFNCRFGDPETQPTMLRLRSDLLDVIDAIDEDRLEEVELRWDPRPALCVVLASQGYPQSPRTGVEIAGPVDSPPDDDVQVFHGATRRDGNRLLTTGGRVLSVAALGRDLAEARRLAYERADRIEFEGVARRSDIGAA